MQVSCDQSGILPEDWAQLSADGGSNAIGSIQEYEVVSRSDGQQTSVEFNICYSHQNERSGGFASGTMKFADMPNEELGAILRKSHEIQVRISRPPKRMKFYSDIQRRRGCKPLLAPDPAGETRWNGCIDETIRANQIMGDLCEANNSLLAPTGDDFRMVKESERESNDLSRLTYTQEDKMILRQFEGAAAPAKYFCLFLQDKKFTWSYVLFTIRIILKQTRSDTFAIVADISHMDRTVDLRRRGDKTILVKKEGALLDPEVDESNYVRVETMHPSIAKYRSLYVDDLSQRLGLNESRLKPELTFSVLLNPLFGLEKRIVEAGLLTKTQYLWAKSGKYNAFFTCQHQHYCATTAISF